MDKDSPVFASAVAQAKADAAHSITTYKVKLLGFALLGYAVIFAAILVLIALVALVIGSAFFSAALFLILLNKKLLLVIVPVVWILARALWVRFELPQGYVLHRADYPALFETLDELGQALKTPVIHRVIVNPELNAAINQTPRLGLLGWHHNTLILGLELLLVLNVDQARAVIAHELGHLSANHSRFNGWIYRVRITWSRVMQAMHGQNGIGGYLMSSFFDWYAPRFAAYSFALAQVNEYEADSVAAELTSPQATASALVSSHVVGPWINKHYWIAFFKAADDRPEPHQAPWHGLIAFLEREEYDRHELNNELQIELLQPTREDDTHPALGDRLKALGVTPALGPLPQQTAAQVWLGAQLEDIVSSFDHNWLELHSDTWRQRYDTVQAARQELAALAAQDASQLAPAQLWQRACLETDYGDRDKAFEIFKQFQQQFPHEPKVAFALGELLYWRNDEALLVEFERALGLRSLINESCRYVCDYLEKHGRHAETEPWRARAQAQIRYDQHAERERAELTSKDSLSKVELDNEYREIILRAVNKTPGIARLWVAQKDVEHYPEIPALALVVDGQGWFKNNNNLAEALEDELELECTFYVLGKGGDYADIAKRVIKIADPLIGQV